MAAKTALGYVLDDSGTLVDAFIQCEAAADPAPTKVELEIVRIVKEHREFRAELKDKEARIENLKEIVDLALDIHTRDPSYVHKTWGFMGNGAIKLLVKKIEALKGE